MAKERDSDHDSPSPRYAEKLNSPAARRRSSFSSMNSIPDNSELKTVKSSDALEEQLLIERNGKFIMVHISELTLAEKEMYTASNNKELPKKSASVKSPVKTQRVPVSKETSVSQSVVLKRDSSHRRSVRSKSSNQTLSRDKTPEIIRSIERRPQVYKLTDEQKQQLRAQRKEREERELEEKKKKREEEEKKLEECNRAFEAWLRRKRDGSRQNRKKENDSDELENDKDEESRKSAFNEWIRIKNEQRKREEKLSRERDRYMMEGSDENTRRDCEIAFKNWLKKKKEDVRRQAEHDNRMRKIYRRQRY